MVTVNFGALRKIVFVLYLCSVLAWYRIKEIILSYVILLGTGCDTVYSTKAILIIPSATTILSIVVTKEEARFDRRIMECKFEHFQRNSKHVISNL